MIYLSRLLVKRKEKFNSWKQGAIPVFWPIILVSGLIFKDNFSTAALLFGICILLLFVARFPFSKMLIVMGGGVGLAALVVTIHLSLPNLNLLPLNVNIVLLQRLGHLYGEDYDFKWAYCRYFWESHAELPTLNIEILESIVCEAKNKQTFAVSSAKMIPQRSQGLTNNTLSKL
jgi:cell division protein FtsW (lipid II flippase)